MPSVASRGQQVPALGEHTRPSPDPPRFVMRYDPRMRALVIVLAVVASRPAVACPAGMHDETELGPMECAPCARGNTQCPCGQPTIHFCVRGDGKQGSYERQTPDGVVIASGTFKNGIKEGAWIEDG